MKTIIATIVTVFTISLSTFAANPLKNMNSNRIVSYYIEATMSGKSDFNKHLFAKNFEYENKANNTKFNKKEYTNFLEKTKGLQYDCSTSYQILDQTGNTCVAKAVMKFKDFTRVDYITIHYNKDSWEISKVVTTYP